MERGSTNTHLFDDDDDSSASKKRKRTIWQHKWTELTEPQRTAATTLGWKEETWNKSEWHLPRKVMWEDLQADVQECLRVLGENADTWDTWSGIDTGKKKRYSHVVAGNSGVMASRPWYRLSLREKAAAEALGFTEETWLCTGMADLHASIDEF